MHQQLQNLIRSLREFESNRLLDNMTESEVRRNTAQFLGILALLGIAVILIQLMSNRDHSGIQIALSMAWAAFYLAAAIAVYFVELKKIWCMRLSLMIIIAEALISITRWSITSEYSPSEGSVVGVLVGLTMGASLLPWSPRQTLGVSSVWIIASISGLFISTPPGDFSIPAAVIAYVAVTIPGVMISFFRMSRFQDQFELHFIQSKYAEVHDDLQAAKSIHERGFPKPKSSGEIRFAYSYQPMSQIGGDSVFASIQRPGEPDSPVTLVLFDVTGHGITAALTANRLQGELMRLTGEDPAIEPDELLCAMDRYVCLTLADSAVLVSAVAIQADPINSTIKVANAGHPSPVLRLQRGALERIEPGSPVLGVGTEHRFTTRVETHPFNEGDSLIAYTDGVSEARLASNKMFGSEGVEAVLARNWVEQSKRWPMQIIEEVENRRAGSPSDDILILEVYRA